MIRKNRRKNIAQTDIKGIIDFLPDPSFAVDLDGRVILWNKAMEKLAGVKAEKIIGKGNYEYALSFYGRRKPFLIDAIRTSSKKLENDYTNVHWDGDTVTADAHAYNVYSGKGAFTSCKARPLYDCRGKMIGAVEVIRDVTDRVKELKEKEEQAAILGAINGMAIRLATVPLEKDIYKLICDELRAALGALGVSIALYDQRENAVTVKYFSAGNRVMNKMVEFLGRKPVGVKLPLKGWKKRVMDGEITNFVDDFSDITFGAIGKSTGRLMNKILGIDHFAALIMKYNGNEPVGTIVVAMPGGKPKIAKDVYNICANLIDVIMRHRIAEENLRVTAERYTTYVESAPYGIVLIDRDGRFVDANEAVCRITGYTKEEMLGLNSADLAVDPSREREMITRVMSKKGYASGTDLIRRKDGVPRWLFIKRARLSPDLFLGFSDDVTAVKESMDALKENEEKYRELFNKSNDCIALIEVDLEDYPGKFIDVNETACRELGYTKEELLKSRVAGILAPVELAKVQALKTVFLTKKAVMAEIELTAKSGKKIPYELSVDGFMLNGKPVMHVIGRNITERRDAGKKQLEYVQNLSSLYSTAMKYVEMGSETNIYASISGQLRQFLVRDVFAIVSSWDDARDSLKVEGVTGDDGMIREMEAVLKRSVVSDEFKLSEKTKNLLLHNRPVILDIEDMNILSEGKLDRSYLRVAELLGVNYVYCAGLAWHGKLLGSITIIAREEISLARQDLIATFVNQSAMAIQRNNTETALRKSEENYRAIFNCVTDMVLIVDAKTAEIIDVNDKADEVLGYRPERLKELGMKALLPDDREYGWESVSAFMASIAPGKTKTFEWLAVTKDRRTIWVEVSARKVLLLGKPCVMLLVRDITERKYAEEERKGMQAHLVETEKMASLGLLAGGIAHEFNNMLQLISGNAEYALKVNDREVVDKSLNAVLTTSGRAAKIVGNLLKFSKPDDYDDSRKDIRQLLDLVFSLVEIQLKKQNIDIIRDYEDVPLIKVNGNEMQQVFLNLINNARDAMLPAGGTLTVALRNKQDHVEILFSDTGQGIEPENITKVFDPFFTTKGAFGGSAVPGTGLGLFVCYGIVQRHGGGLSVESTPGEGATFKIELPLE